MKGTTMPFMPLIAFAITFLALPIVAWSDDSTKPETPTLTVVATGSVSVPPDTAFVTLGMDTAGKSLAEAQRQNSAVMQKVLERFRELKIEKERIQTSAFTVSPQYKPLPKRPSDAPPAPPEIIGYTVSNTMTIEVREIEKVGGVIEEGLSAGANHFHGLRWALRDEQQARLSALKTAARKAREKAAALSEALNVKLGRVANVTEGSQIVHPAPRVGRAMATMEMAGGEVPISSGEMRVEGTVTLVYELAP
jgi:uncharacterized protein YggE